MIDFYTLVASALLSAVIGPVSVIVFTAWVNRGKNIADEQVSLSSALRGAGETLSGAWQEIKTLKIENQVLGDRLVVIGRKLDRYVSWADRLVDHIEKIDPKKAHGEIPAIEKDA